VTVKDKTVKAVTLPAPCISMRKSECEKEPNRQNSVVHLLFPNIVQRGQKVTGGVLPIKSPISDWMSTYLRDFRTTNDELQFDLDNNDAAWCGFEIS